MIVKLKRLIQGDDGTQGVMSVPGGPTYPTLELPWRDNKNNLSCIPVGSYETALRWSPKRIMNVYGLQTVPGRSDIEIHAGNWAGDTTLGMKSDVDGCILLGKEFAHIEPHLEQIAVTQSKVAIWEFMQFMQGQSFTLEISNG